MFRQERDRKINFTFSFPYAEYPYANFPADTATAQSARLFQYTRSTMAQSAVLYISYIDPGSTLLHFFQGKTIDFAIPNIVLK